jgi:hypothetical protein
MAVLEQLAGIIVVVAGLMLLSIPIAIIAAGIMLVVHGVAREMVNEKEKHDGARDADTRHAERDARA